MPQADLQGRGTASLAELRESRNARLQPVQDELTQAVEALPSSAGAHRSRSV